MPRVFLRKPFAQEHMPQMPAAMVAQDLRPPSVGIGQALYGSGNLLIETGPAAARAEFVVGTVKRGFATPAHKGSFASEILIFPRERHFGALVHDHPLLLGREGIVVFRVFHKLKLPLYSTKEYIIAKYIDKIYILIKIDHPT